MQTSNIIWKMSGKISSILLRYPTLSELFCVVAAKAFSLSDVMWTAVLVSERLSDYSSSQQALSHGGVGVGAHLFLICSK